MPEKAKKTKPKKVVKKKVVKKASARRATKSEVQPRTRKVSKKSVPPVEPKAAEPKKKLTPSLAAAEPKKTPARTATRSVAGGVVSGKYIEAVGRRKTAVARVRLFEKGKKEIFINDKDYQDYFPNFELQKIVKAPLEMMGVEGQFGITVKVKGSGRHSQAEAVRHGVSRGLIKFDPEFRKRLKKAGFLTRDPRMRERKKFGLKRARRGPQWSKR